MSIGHCLRRWRLKRGLSASEVEQKAGLSPASVQSLETGQMDPPVSMIASIADVFGIPVSWLFGDPDQLEALVLEHSEKRLDGDATLERSVDPVIEQILRAQPGGRNLFHLLSVLIQNGEEKHLRAAEVNLRSLIKQTRASLIPWENRQPGNFDPPND